MRDEIDIGETVVAQITELLGLFGMALMIGGFGFGWTAFRAYALYAGWGPEPNAWIAVAVGTLAGVSVVWGMIADCLERIANKFQSQMKLPRLLGVRKAIGDAFLGAVFAVFVAIIGGMIYFKVKGHSPAAGTFPLVGAFGVAAGFLFGFEKQFGKDGKLGEGRLFSYFRVALAGVLGGFGLFSLIVALSLFYEGSPNEILPEAFEVALLAGAVFGLAAICEHAYKRREFLPLAIIYAVVPGALAGGVAAVAVGFWLVVHGEKPPFAIIVIGIALGASFGLWRSFGRNRTVSRTERFFGLVDFMATDRPRLLGLGLCFVAAGVLILWFSVPPFFSFLVARNAAIDDMALPAGGMAIGLYLLLAHGLLPVWIAVRGPRLRNDTHGKERWATIAEMRRARLMPRKDGIYLGQFLADGAGIDAVAYPGPVHLITIGRTGAGKGTGLIIPNLSALRRSILIIDPKGEAAAITARKRAKFGRVVMLNPFNILAEDRPWMESHGFNPLVTIRMDENFLDDCTIIGQSLIKQEKGSNGRFFSTSAHDLMTALVMHEKIMRRQNANLANVRAMLTEPWGGDERTGPTGIARTIADMTLNDYEPLRAKAGRFKIASNSNRDIISTAINETAFIDSPPVASDLESKSDFRFADMKDEIVTVYLILPATHLESHSNWLRLIIASALRELLSAPANSARPPVLFMLDEFAQLSHLPAISNAMNIARSFGVQLWPFVQDLNQLKDIYDDGWENFLGASAALTAYAPRDLFTSNYLSNLCGNKTVIVESENIRADPSTPGGGFSPQSQPLIRPEELRGMPAGQLLCLVDPVKHPFLGRAPGYWDTAFDEGLDVNPYHSG
jgi:type IV secretion system protein VirD4